MTAMDIHNRFHEDDGDDLWGSYVKPIEQLWSYGCRGFSGFSCFTDLSRLAA